MASPNTSTADTAARPRNKALPVLLVIAVIGLVWGGKTVLYNQAHESTENAQFDGTIIPVIAKVGGFVTAVRAVENQRVVIGDTLVQIDTSEYLMRVQQSDAELAAAEAAAGSAGSAGQAEAAVQSASSQRLVIDAQIQSARAAVAKATADLARVKELVAKQIVSRQQLDAAQASADQANAALAAAERQSATATAQFTGAQAGAKFALARLAGARAARANALLQLGYTHVRAPLAGSVSRKQVEVGQLVQAGQPLLTLVSDTSGLIVANFKETQLANMKLGQSVTVEVDAYPGCDAVGTVESMSAATGARFALLPPDNSTGNFTKVVQRVPVRIKVTTGCGATRPLRPGMSVTVHVSIK